MTMSTRYSTSRQKACRQCADAKAKCDRKRPRCTRCQQRHLSCSHVSRRASELTTDLNETSVPSASSAPLTPASVASANQSSYRSPGSSCTGLPRGQPTVDYTQEATIDEHAWLCDEPSRSDPLHNDGHSPFSSELVCPINPEDIQNRWLNSYVPIPGQQPKTYPANVTIFIFKTLKAYAAIAIRGRGVPPFIHPTHLLPGVGGHNLSTCLSLVRICHQPLPGSNNATAAIIKQEMGRVYENVDSYTGANILFAFQAYLVYSLVLFFHLDHGQDPFLRQAMMNLQQLASTACRLGLVCTSEQSNSRPNWETWLVAEAKRRTLYIMYLLDSLLAAQDRLPTFLGTELRGLPASGGKSLWRAESRKLWETEYNSYLVEWPAGGLRIEELWPIPENMSVEGAAQQRKRVDHWLEEADEFCAMLHAVTCCTHGG